MENLLPNNPICPLLSMAAGFFSQGAQQTAICKEWGCAWWDRECQECFIATIGLALEEISERSTDGRPVNPQGEPTVTITSVTLGERIKAARKQIGLSQAELAEKMGVHQATISQYENGSCKPSLGTVRKLALELGVSVYDLAGRQTGE